jgi:acetyl-CoA acetyltransferase
MSAFPRDKAAIVGIGQTEFGKGLADSELVLGLRATVAALADAGLQPQDVDGIVRYDMQADDEIEFARNLGCRELRFWSAVGWGGGASCAVVAHAALAVAAGVADTVLCVRSRKRSARGSRPWAQTGDRVAGVWGYEVPYGCVRPVDQVALFARWHMLTYGTTSLQFGAAAVACRKHASRNPNALMRAPITLADHQASRMIADPLRLLDNGLETDGACAVVVTSAERARWLRQPPVYISSAVQAAGPDPMLMSYWYQPGNLDMHSAFASQRLFEQADMTPADIDVALLYDVFSPLIPYQLEEYGFCKRGEGGPFVEDGGIEWPDGRLPVNTHGGSLSEAYIHGMNHVLEGVRQMRGTSTCQVPGAERALVTGGPDVPTSALVLRR